VITGWQIPVARKLLGWTAHALARKANLPLVTVNRAELLDSGDGITVVRAKKIQRALEAAGVEFIVESGGGPRARLRKP
jgi:hypothetical protein